MGCMLLPHLVQEMENTVSIQVEDTERWSSHWNCFQCCRRGTGTVTAETPFATPDPLLTQSEDSDSEVIVLTDENT